MSISSRTIAASTLVLLLSLSLLLGACYPNPQPAGLTPVPTLAPAEQVALVGELQRPVEAIATSVLVETGGGDAAAGAPVYLLHCSRCHGIAGQGEIGPRFRNSIYVQSADKEELFVMIAAGPPGTVMPAWLQSEGGPLTSTQIDDVIAYMRTFRHILSLPAFVPPAPEQRPTPLPPGAPTPEPARPSMPGDLGNAVSLTGDAVRGRRAFGMYCASCHGPEGIQGVCNPGSDDGTVPELDPIDPTISNADARIFAENVDLFIEHGSIPEGPNPQMMMPSFGDSSMLTNGEIADLIAYVVQLNEQTETDE